MSVADRQLGQALATDYFFLREQLTDEQLDVLARVRGFVDDGGVRSADRHLPLQRKPPGI